MEKRGGGGDKERVRSRERDGGRRRCCLFNVPTCEGEVGVGEGLRSHLPAAVYLCGVQVRSPHSGSQTFASLAHGTQTRLTCGTQPSDGSDRVPTSPSGLQRCHSVASFETRWKQQQRSELMGNSKVITDFPGCLGFPCTQIPVKCSGTCIPRRLRWGR